MNIWHNSMMETLYPSADASGESTCVVKITDSEILVEYEDEGFVQYRGENNGTGHFVLEAPEVNGRASLHMFPNAAILEGYWEEGVYHGMWRIHLKE